MHALQQELKRQVQVVTWNGAKVGRIGQKLRSSKQVVEVHFDEEHANTVNRALLVAIALLQTLPLLHRPIYNLFKLTRDE